MNVRIIEIADASALHPVTLSRRISEVPIAGATFAELQRRRLAAAGPVSVVLREDFWPSEELVAKFADAGEFAVYDVDGHTPLCWASGSEEPPESPDVKFSIDEKSRIIRYPWDFLFVNEEVVGGITDDEIAGEIRNGVNMDGRVRIGKGTVLLPGVYIEGNAVIGENCKVGPNCYIRGNTSIGNGCHIGQAVEIKNSILMDKVGAGHLSYVGDSIVGYKANLGAGTITANLRHDNKNHRSVVHGNLIDTGRRKFGAIIGDNVHTGIHTSIYPARKIWNDRITVPGEIVQKDVC